MPLGCLQRQRSRKSEFSDTFQYQYGPLKKHSHFRKNTGNSELHEVDLVQKAELGFLE